MRTWDIFNDVVRWGLLQDRRAVPRRDKLGVHDGARDSEVGKLACVWSMVDNL
jgi:hypothetical protein